MLRITDVLTRNLINAAIQHDMSMITNKRANYNIMTGQMLNDLINAIRSCGVTFKVWTDKTKIFECTSLMGKDKAKLLQDLPEKLVNCQPDDFCSVIQQIWKVPIAIATYEHYKLFI